MNWSTRLLAGLSIILGAAKTTHATDTLVALKPSPAIETFLMLQLWSSYTTKEQVFDPVQQTYRPVDNRYNLWFRRAIVGFKAQPYQTLRFKLMTSFDGIGKDLFAGANGSVNNGALPKIGILEAYAQWQCWPESEALHLVAGYFRPSIGRESLTSSWSVTSMDRALGATYFRYHLTGSVFGRTAGLQLGGLLPYPDQRFGFEYSLGLFNPQFAGPEGTSSEAYSPLLATRGAIYLGDPEMETYQVHRNSSFLGKRRGFTLAANAAWQGRSDLFHRSATLSADLLLNWNNLNLDGEWSYLRREGERLLPDDRLRQFASVSTTGHIRVSYHFNTKSDRLLEPSLTYMFFKGARNEMGQADALSVGAFSGCDTALDLGLNCYLKQHRCKVLLHYNWRWGEAGAAGDGSTVNYYFSQAGIGAIRRGDWLGLGLNWII